LLEGHPINRQRVAEGKRPATQIWLWGQGQAPALPKFQELHGIRGAIVTGVDLIRGVGALLGWDRIEIPGVTDYLDNDYAAQGRGGIDALPDYDLICLHIEAPDEASHEGRVDAKIEALERIDHEIVGPLLAALPRYGPWRLLVSPDHPTPVRTRSHAHGYVPFVMAGTGIPADPHVSYDEIAAASSPLVFDPGHELMAKFLSR
jgi:2,3-bisphosphoglycerate-independent phosphoglycerate mutase